MTNRIPLVVNSVTKIIEELPVSDNLDLSGSNISNVGNVNVSGSLNSNANVVAVGVKTDNIYHANGDPYVFGTSAAGSNTQLQFNSNNSFDASANLTFNSSTNQLSVTGTLNVSGNANVGNVSATNGDFSYLSGNGANLFSITGANVTGTVANANYATYSGTAYSVAGANVTGEVANANYASYANLANIANVAYSISGSNVTGEVANANYASYANLANIANVAYSVDGANVTGTVANANYALYTNLANTANSVAGANVTGEVANANYATYAGTAYSVAGANVTGEVANANYATYAGTAYSVAGANVTGEVANANYSTTAGTVVASSQPNITSIGTLVDLNVSGNAVIGGNLVVNGNTTTINIETVVIEDPIIEMGGGANGAPLTNNDGKDRGSLLHYYTAAPVDAFMGWDNSNSEFAFGSNVTVSNEIVTFNSLGNVRASYFIGNGSQLTGVTATNAETANTANSATTAGTVTANAQPNITSVGTLAYLDVSGNLTAGNLIGPLANGNSNVLIPAANGNINLTVAGNANVVVVTGTGINVNGTISSSGNISGLNANLGNLVEANYFAGNGASLSGITGANVTGTVANANYATYSGIAYSVSGANVTGEVANANYASYANVSNVAYSVAGANVTGEVANANYASYANIANVAYSVAGANVTGEVANANYATYSGTAYSVSGSNVTGEVANANYATYAGTAYSVAGANVTGTVANANYSLYSNVANTANIANVAYSVSGANVVGEVANANYAIYSGTAFNVAGANVTGEVANANYATYSGTAFSVSGANVVGTVANANYSFYSNVANVANIANVAYSVAVANVSGIGNIATVNLDGNSSNILYGNGVFASSPVTYGDSNVASFLASYGSNTLVTTGNVSVGNIIGNGQALTGLTGANVTGEVANANYASYANVANIANVAYSVSGSNVTGEVANANYASYAGTAYSVAGANVTGEVANANYAAYAGNVVTAAQPNITSVGNLTGLTVSGNTTIAGNLVVTGNVTYINVASVEIEDPIISMGGGVNAAPLTSNDGKDRGSILHYYTTAPVDAFMGWDNGNSEFAFGSNVTVSNEVVTFNSLGNVRASYFFGNGSQLTGVTATNAETANTANTANYANTAGTVTANAQPNITSVGTLAYLDVSGNLTAGNLIGPLANGNSNILIPAANGNINLTVAGNANVVVVTGTGINVAGTVNASGNISALNANLGNLVEANYFAGNGASLSGIAGANITGEVANANYASYANLANIANIAYSVSGANVTGEVANANYATYAGTAYSVAGANVTGEVANANYAGYSNIANIANVAYSVAVANVSGIGNIATVNLDGNASNILYGNGVFASSPITYGNSNVASFLASYGSNTIDTTGNVTVGNIIGNGQGLTGLTGANVTGTVANANYATYAGTAYSVAGANVTGEVANANYAAYAGTAYSVAGANVTGQVANANYAGYANLANIANVAYSVAGANVTGEVANANYATYAGTAYSVAGANVTGEVANANYAAYAGNVVTASQPNITSVGNLTGLTVSGNATIAGNLVVTGNTTYINVGSVEIEDPIISMGGGVNAAPLTTNDGKDRGTLLHYYTTAPVDAFMGWDSGNSEFAFGSNVTVSNEVVTFNSLGNVRASYFIGNGSQLTGVTATNAETANTANSATTAGTVTANAQPNITSVGTLAYLDVSGNLSAGNLIGPLANGNSNVLIPAANGNINLTVAGNANVLVITGTGINVAGTVNASGNISALNANLGNLVEANYFAGNGASLSGITGANVTGTVANANYASYANIANIANVAYSVSGSNVSGEVANANYASYANVANIANVAYSVSGANVSGEVANANYATYAGTAYSVAVANVSGIGNIATANLDGNASNILYGNGTFASAPVTYGDSNVVSLLSSFGSNTIVTTGNVTAGNIIGNGQALTGLAGANVTGAVAYATTANSVAGANVSGEVAYAATANAVAGGNVSGQVSNALVAGTVYTAAQPNITSVGTLTELSVSNATGNASFAVANLSLGDVANLHISGGTANYVLKTDGAGNLSWTAQTGGGGGTGDAISNGSSNVSIPAVNGDVLVSVAGNANIAVITGTGINVSGTLNVTGNANVGNIGAANGVFAFVVGDGSGLWSITGANVTGVVANATYSDAAGTAGTVTTGAQPNITSVGTLTDLSVINATGNASFAVANVSLGDVANLHISGGTANYVLKTDGTGNLSWTPQTGGGGGAGDAISNGTSNVSILVANGNITASVNGNANIVTITGTGANVSGTLNVTGNANVGNIGAASGVFTTVEGSLTTAAQPNITSVGTLANLGVSGDITAGNIYANSGAVGANTLTIANTASIGGNLDMNSKHIINLAEPVNPQDAATKNYVDQVAQGLHTHDACQVATPNTLAVLTSGTVTYDNGSSGVGATLTTTGSFNLIDGVNVQTSGTRILVKNEANTAHNGIYVWSNATVITRADDFNTPTEMAGGDFTFVQNGTLYDNTGWVMTDPVATVGTTPVYWSQFSGAGTYVAGTGLLLTGSEFSIANTAVTAATYGNGDRVAQFTVNSQGQLTAASDVVIAANAANLTGTTLNSSIVTSSLTSVGELTGLTSNGIINFTGASNVSLGNVANIKIAGGTANYVLKTDGAGNLGWVSGGSVTDLNGTNQSLANLDVTGNLTLTVSNFKLSGGVAGQAIVTDGNGNLSFSTVATSTIITDTFTGDGTTTVFTLSASADISETTVNYNGTMLLRSSYTVSGNTLTFSSPPASGASIEVSIFTSLAGVVNLSNVAIGNLTTTNWATFGQTTDVLVPLTGATGNVTHNMTGTSVFYHSSIAGAFNANLTNVPTTNNRTIVVVLILEQGATPYIPGLQIGGVTQTISWLSGITPAGNANKTDTVTFNLIRVGNAWKVLGFAGVYG